MRKVKNENDIFDAILGAETALEKGIAASNALTEGYFETLNPDVSYLQANYSNMSGLAYIISDYLNAIKTNVDKISDLAGGIETA